MSNISNAPKVLGVRVEGDLSYLIVSLYRESWKRDANFVTFLNEFSMSSFVM